MNNQYVFDMVKTFGTERVDMDQEPGKAQIISFGSVVVYIVFLWVFISLLPFVLGGFEMFADWGVAQRAQFGDMFGFTNSVFSSLAFAALIYTIYLQRKDLALQRVALQKQEEDLALTRKELKLTRAEVQRSAAAQEKSEEALRKQAASLKITAEINALTALLGKITSDLEARPDRAFCTEFTNTSDLVARRDGYIERLEGILDGKAD